jgi:hypothetical protein
MASDGHKQMVARSTLDDVVQTFVLTGLPTNMLRPSLDARQPRGAGKRLRQPRRSHRARRQLQHLA